MTTDLDNRNILPVARQTAASHLIVIELRPGQDTDVAESINGLISNLALTKGCVGYAVAPHPVDARTWLIQGSWECLATMHQHFQSSALQGLISHLRSLPVYRMAFNCKADGF